MYSAPGSIREEMSTGYVLGNLLKAVRLIILKALMIQRTANSSSNMGQQQNQRRFERYCSTS
jgi:hypothetical protein